jgi:glycosyltransferase involved in cell wall biosynthesis
MNASGRFENRNQSLPTVSIVMPARNAAATIAASLHSVFAQDYAGPWEVIVAEGSSEDATRDVLADLARNEERLRVVDNPRRSTPAALNRAIGESKGEVIVRCDAHAQLPHNYVSTAVRLLANTGADNVGGAQIPVGRTLLERAIALAMSSPLGAGDARYRLGGPAGPTDTVYLGVFRREAIERVGGFDESLERNQDYELNIRIRQSGGIVYFHPDLAVRYKTRGSLTSLWSQYFDYGRWKRLVVRRHPRSLRWRQLAAPLLVVGLTVSLAGLLTPWQNLGLIIPGTYVIAMAAGGAWLSFRRRDLAGLLLPIVLPVMHLAWGIGFLVGLQRAST